MRPPNLMTLPAFLPTDLRALVYDATLYYLFFRFMKWLLSPHLFRSPFADIPGPQRKSWFTGNLGQLFNAKGLPFHLDLVDRFGGMVKVHGFFGDEQLYISDPTALQSIVVKDQDAFEETAVFTEGNKIIFGPGLVATTGDQHKRQRKIVNPVFSVKQLKELSPLLYDIAEKLGDVLANESKGQVQKNGRSILDMSEWMSRVALETVGQAILGHSFDPLDSPNTNPYSAAIKELIPTIFSLALVRQFAPFLSRLGSPSFRRRLVEWTPNRAVQKIKDIADVMHNTAVDILREKREALAMSSRSASTPGNGARDIISVLLKANDQAGERDKLSEAELTGQMTVLIFGAQDTTSGSLSRILHVLSQRPDIQDRVRDEIAAALAEEGNTDGRLSYEHISSLPWLDAVIKETLRLYPPVPFVRRTAIKERTLFYTSNNPEDSGTLRHVNVPVGTTLFVGIAGSNRLESVWGPDAKEWKPERWLAEHTAASSDPARQKLPGIYSGMMSFFGGGRSCIGYKFALIEMKILLATLLTRFRFSPSGDWIVWNLSQIIAPSVRNEAQSKDGDLIVEENKGLPLEVEILR